MKSEEYISMLFKKHEGVFVGGKYDTDVAVKPAISSKSCFYAINPIDPYKDYAEASRGTEKEYVARRADINVSSFRNFMFEMDNVPLEEQMEILQKCEIPFTAVVFSGKKSYHAIIALEDGLDLEPHCPDAIMSYKRIWKQIAAYINRVAGRDVVDESGKNPSRLTRLPGAYRKGGQLQELVKLGEKLTAAQFDNLLEICPPIYTPVIEKNTSIPEDHIIESASEFYDLCPRGLKLLLKYPEWVSVNGNYPHLFRLTLWAIDSTNISKEVFLEVLEDRVFEEFKKVRYPKNKWYSAVNHAYGMKGVN